VTNGNPPSNIPLPISESKILFPMMRLLFQYHISDTSNVLIFRNTACKTGVGEEQEVLQPVREDFIEYVFVATNHNYILFFTEMGKVYWLRVFEVPEGNKTSKGRAIQNMINIDPNDKIRAFINVKDLKDQEYINNNYVVLCTKNGIIKKTTLEAYSRPRSEWNQCHYRKRGRSIARGSSD